MNDDKHIDDNKQELEAEVIEDQERKEEAVDYEDKYRRSLAEYQNLLKQTAREKFETIRYANENLLQELLPVYSNLKIALVHAGSGDSAWLDGVKFVTKQFKDVLSAVGVEEIETVGKPYDHNVMEALQEEITADEAQAGIVVREAAAGYKLNGRLITPAKVVVYKFSKQEPGA